LGYECVRQVAGERATHVFLARDTSVMLAYSSEHDSVNESLGSRGCNAD
jgi:hypothetical protein